MNSNTIDTDVDEAGWRRMGVAAGLDESQMANFAFTSSWIVNWFLLGAKLGKCKALS